MNMFYYQFFISVCIYLSRFLRPVVTEVRSGVAGFIVWSSTRYQPTFIQFICNERWPNRKKWNTIIWSGLCL